MSDTPGPVGSGVETDPPTEASAPSSLLGDDLETFERYLTGQSVGPLAVCSPPFGGRDRLLEYAADRLGTEYVALGPDDGPERVYSELESGPVVIDDCHQLYEHRVGGFDSLDTVLRAIVDHEAAVVTGWNEYAWTYLTRVRGLDRTFAHRAETDVAASDDIAAQILERYDELPAFAADTTASEGLVDIRRYEVGWRSHSVSVPVPVLKRPAIQDTVSDEEVDPKDVVFERLAAVSDGNVGVATAIWDASRREEVRPSDIVAPGTDLTLDREEAFYLRLVLLKEHVECSELSRIIDESERVLGRLRREGLVSVTDGVVSLEPSAVPTVVTETERRGFR